MASRLRLVSRRLRVQLTAESPHGDDYPVSNVNFAGAEQFCRQLVKIANQFGNLPNDWEFRLLTEAQWKYTCRTGSISDSPMWTLRSSLAPSLQWHWGTAEEKLENDRTTSFEVLVLQGDLPTAMRAELAALADFNKALVQLALRESTTLELNGLNAELR